MKKFKLKLLVNRVSEDSSLVAGDTYETDNDEAWRMIEGGLAVLEKGKPPHKPMNSEKTPFDLESKPDDPAPIPVESETTPHEPENSEKTPFDLESKPDDPAPIPN